MPTLSRVIARYNKITVYLVIEVNRVSCLQRPVGHRDGPAVWPVHRPHGRRDVSVAGARPAHLRVRRVRRVRQALGHPRVSVQADLPRTRERYQCRHGTYASVLGQY